LVTITIDYHVVDTVPTRHPERRLPSTIAKRWKEVADRNGGESIRVIIPDSIDETIFQLLDAIDQGLLPLSFTSSNGTIVNLAEEGMGELAGWYMSSGGWRGLYSNERVHDDFSDLDPGSKS
jgi:hypothetical protein